MQERDKHAEGERERGKERKVHNWDIVPPVFPPLLGFVAKIACNLTDSQRQQQQSKQLQSKLLSGAHLVKSCLCVCVWGGELNFEGVARGAFWGVIILMSLHKSHLHFSQLSNCC